MEEMLIETEIVLILGTHIVIYSQEGISEDQIRFMGMEEVIGPRPNT